MGNVYSLKCPEMKLELRVGVNGQLFSGKDREGRDYHETLTKFMYTCMGKEMFYVSEGANNGVIDDVHCCLFEPDRDYDERPVADAELKEDGWAEATPEQLSAVAEAVANGTLGHITGVTLHTEAFKKL